MKKFAFVCLAFIMATPAWADSYRLGVTPGLPTAPWWTTIPNMQKGDPMPPAGNAFINLSGFIVISQ